MSNVQLTFILYIYSLPYVLYHSTNILLSTDTFNTDIMNKMNPIMI